MANETIAYNDAFRLLICSADSGELFWKERPLSDFINQRIMNGWNARRAGKPAGSLDSSNGYIKVQLLGRKHYAHRLVWLLAHGDHPTGEIDHLNGDRTDNRVANLRDVTHAANTRNKGQVRSLLGITGVYRSGSGWTAKLSHKHLGSFRTLEEALAARRVAEITSGFTEEHGKRPSWVMTKQTG